MRSSNCLTRRWRTTARALALTGNFTTEALPPSRTSRRRKRNWKRHALRRPIFACNAPRREHAIAVLLGQNPSAFHMDASPLAVSAAPPPIDPGLPSSLLERRPDVAAAERRTAAANAQIGVARAAYFPVFSLGAAAGFDSTSASNWLTAPSQLWSAGTGSRQY